MYHKTKCPKFDFVVFDLPCYCFQLWFAFLKGGIGQRCCNMQFTFVYKLKKK